MQHITHLKPSQYILDTSTAAIRESTWQTLCAHHAHLSWPPHLVDEILNEVSNPSTSFRQLCTIAAEAPLRQYPPTKSVAVEALLGAPSDPQRTLLTPFLQRVGRRIASKLEITPTRQLQEEIEELVAANYFKSAVQFQPSGDRNGATVTYGFEAYQMLMSKSCLRQAGRILYHHSPLTLDADESAIIEPTYTLPLRATPEQNDLRRHLASALKLALADPMAWQMIHAMAYRDLSQGEVACELVKNRKTLSGMVASKIKKNLQRELAEAFGLEKEQSASMAAISKALAGLFTEDEFCSLIPRPVCARQIEHPAINLPTRVTPEQSRQQKPDHERERGI